ncbi:MAG: PAS domain-containing protein [Candidatus Methanomethyliales bacterium]|nr:PAS domain-containing protein [Candidatus Methanomethylicales archaeon]
MAREAREKGKLLELLVDEHTEALRESEVKYEELDDLAKSIIFKWDSEGRVLWMNKYGLQFFGFSEEEVVGGSAYETFVPRTESTGRDLSNLVKEIFKNEEKYVSHINENVKKDGTRVWIHWSNKPIRGADGKSVAILSIGMDITDKVKMHKLSSNSKKPGSSEGFTSRSSHQAQPWATC